MTRLRSFFARVRKYVIAQLEYFDLWLMFGANTRPMLERVRRESEEYWRERESARRK